MTNHPFGRVPLRIFFRPCADIHRGEAWLPEGWRVLHVKEAHRAPNVDADAEPGFEFLCVQEAPEGI